MSGPRPAFRTPPVCLLLALALAACVGGIEDGAAPGGDTPPEGSSPASGSPARPGAGTAPGGPVAAPSGWQPTRPCEPVLPRRVTRLQDRHLANAVRDLIGLERAPVVETASGDADAFLANRAASVTGAVALKLRDVAEAAAAEATATGKPAVRCTGSEVDCARAFVERFAPRAFRRPLASEERERLLAVYTAGRDAYGGHAGGIRLVIEAVLQSPSFLYQTELGAPGAGARTRLTPHELAAKLAFFLRDSLPDEGLWRAAEDGRLATPAGLAAELDRLMQLPEVKANVTRIFVRLFQAERIAGISKAPEIKEFTPALAESMTREVHRFVEEVLWKGGARLGDLLTSRRTFVDRALAAIYGVRHSGASGFEAVTLPADQRAGILTQPGLMALEALPAESSVVHRGVFVVRELLCFHPPPPQTDDLEQGELLKKQEPTERGRAERRLQVGRCAACHASFDPLGVTFEHYDTLGRYRTRIRTPAGEVSVDASWDLSVYDLQGRVQNAVELAGRLAASRAVRECMTRQLASYAVGERLDDELACTVGDIGQGFDARGGDLLQLVRLVAGWAGLRDRREEAP